MTNSTSTNPNVTFRVVDRIYNKITNCGKGTTYFEFKTEDEARTKVKELINEYSFFGEEIYQPEGRSRKWISRDDNDVRGHYILIIERHLWKKESPESIESEL